MPPTCIILIHSSASLTQATIITDTSQENVVIVIEIIAGGPPTDPPWLIMEFIALNLRTAKPTIAEVPLIFHGICSGIEYIHKQGLTHRDIKPENILIAVDPDSNVKTAKLCDFGLATRAVEMHEYLGTIVYVAPEMNACETEYISYTNAIDNWALGLILFELVVGKCLLRTGLNPQQRPHPATYRNWLWVTVRAWQQHAPKIYEPLLTGLLEEDPWKRWTAEMARQYIVRSFPELARYDKDPPVKIASTNGAFMQDPSNPTRKRQKTDQKSPGSSQDADGETSEEISPNNKGKQPVRD